MLVMLPKKSIYLVITILVTVKSDTSCPRGCRCYPSKYQRSVVCQGADYKSLPTDLPSWMAQLDMSNNQISHLDADAFAKFPDLNEVKMVGNLLTSLPEGLFSKNPLMKNIDFSSNKITHLPKPQQ